MYKLGLKSKLSDFGRVLQLELEELIFNAPNATISISWD